MIGGWILAAGGAWAMPGVGTEISHTRGKRDGIVVLWPRVVPESDDALVNQVAGSVQKAIAEAVSDYAPPERTTLRPSPERVCPREGCRALSISVMVGQQSGGCAAVALIGPPGPEAQRMVPLAGSIDMAGPGVPYRDPPEDHLVIHEFVPCAELVGKLDLAALTTAIEQSRPAP